MKKQISCIVNLLIIITAVGLPSVYGDDNPPSQPAEIAESKYPGLFTSALRLAVLHPLPTGELLVSGKLKITQTQLGAEIDKSPANLRKQLNGNFDYN